MAFCKVCVCGEKITFERRLSFPDNCPACGRKLVEFLTYTEDDPRVEELMKSKEIETDSDNDNRDVPIGIKTNKRKYILKLSNGREIEIPDEGCIIGRTEIGAEELSEFPSVSRQHLRIIPRRNVGVLVEDLSTYGTLVDGQRIIKNSPVRVAVGSKVTLCNLETILTIREESDI